MLSIDAVNDVRLPADIKMRKGKFNISVPMVLDPTIELLQFLSNFIIIRCEALIMTDVVEYEAFSHLFDPIGYGEYPPFYDFALTKEQDGTISVRPTRMGSNKHEKVRATRKIDVR